MSLASPTSACPVATAVAGPLDEPARQRSGQRAVGGGAVVRVGARDRVGELVRAGQPAHRRSALEQVEHRGRVLALAGSLPQPGGVPCADPVAAHGEQVLDRDAEAEQRTLERALVERVADRAPDGPVEARRATGDVGRRDAPAPVGPLPHLRLQTGAPAVVAGGRDDQPAVVGEAPRLDAVQHPGRDPAAGAAERADGVVPDQQAVAVARASVSGPGANASSRAATSSVASARS